MNTTKAPKLEISSNYASFTPNDEQRPIIERHVSKLAEIMAKMGFLPSKPIQCFKKGSKYVLMGFSLSLTQATLNNSVASIM
jgi:hypothetical protein